MVWVPSIPRDVFLKWLLVQVHPLHHLMYKKPYIEEDQAIRL